MSPGKYKPFIWSGGRQCGRWCTASSIAACRCVAIAVVGAVYVYRDDVNQAIGIAWETLGASWMFQHESFEVWLYVCTAGSMPIYGSGYALKSVCCLLGANIDHPSWASSNLMRPTVGNIRTATCSASASSTLQSIVRSPGLCKTRAKRSRGICRPCWGVQSVLVQPRLKSSRKYHNCSYLWYVTNSAVYRIQGTAVSMKP